MPRIRTVKPDLWHDEAIGEISLGARLTFVGLITQADDEGRQKGDPRLIRSLLFPYDDFTLPEVSGWLAELSGAGLIDYYNVGGKDFIELPTWSSHQRISHATDSALPSAAEADSAVLPEDSGAAPEDSALKGREGKGEEGKGKDISVEQPLDAPADLLEVFDYWREVTGKAGAKLTSDRRTMFKARKAEGFSVEEMKLAIDGSQTDDAVDRKSGHRYDDFKNIFRNGTNLDVNIGRVQSAKPDTSEFIARMKARRG